MGLLSSLFGQKKPAKNTNTALQEQIRKANSGDIPSILELGRDCRRGVSMEISRDEVGKLLEKAAAQGNGEAMEILGDLHNPTNLFKICADAELALKWYQKACSAGHTKAACKAGILFMGTGDRPKDYAKAKRFFAMGANGGDAASARELGKMLDTGRGGEKDLKKAYALYQQAVSSGDIAAMFHLGDMYYFGRGVEKDRAQAAEYFRKAKARNYPDAEAMLDYMMLMSEIPLTGTDSDVFYHLVRLAEGFSKNRANFILGMFFETGTCVDQDLDKAIRHYEKSAKTGNLAAMRKISLLEKKDFPGHRPDMDKAAYWEKRLREELGS